MQFILFCVSYRFTLVFFCISLNQAFSLKYKRYRFTLVLFHTFLNLLLYHIICNFRFTPMLFLIILNLNFHISWVFNRFTPMLFLIILNPQRFFRIHTYLSNKCFMTFFTFKGQNPCPQLASLSFLRLIPIVRSSTKYFSFSFNFLYTP